MNHESESNVVPFPEPEQEPKADKIAEITEKLVEHNKTSGPLFGKAVGNLDKHLKEQAAAGETECAYHPVLVKEGGAKEMMLAVPMRNLNELESFLHKMNTAKDTDEKLAKLNFQRVVGPGITAIVITYGEAPEENTPGVSPESIRDGLAMTSQDMAA